MSNTSSLCCAVLLFFLGRLCGSTPDPDGVLSKLKVFCRDSRILLFDSNLQLLLFVGTLGSCFFLFVKESVFFNEFAAASPTFELRDCERFEHKELKSTCTTHITFFVIFVF